MSSRSGQPWTDAEDQLLLDLLALGKAVPDCARVLERTWGAVNTRMCILRQENIEEPAQLLLSDQLLIHLTRHYRKSASEIAAFLGHEPNAVAQRLHLIEARR